MPIKWKSFEITWASFQFQISIWFSKVQKRNCLTGWSDYITWFYWKLLVPHPRSCSEISLGKLTCNSLHPFTNINGNLESQSLEVVLAHHKHNQSAVHSFLTVVLSFVKSELVKNESDFVRSVKTGLGRWMLVVVVISVDAYPFLTF